MSKCTYFRIRLKVNQIDCGEKLFSHCIGVDDFLKQNISQKYDIIYLEPKKHKLSLIDDAFTIIESGGMMGLTFSEFKPNSLNKQAEKNSLFYETENNFQAYPEVPKYIYLQYWMRNMLYLISEKAENKNMRI